MKRKLIGLATMLLVLPTCLLASCDKDNTNLPTVEDTPTASETNEDNKNTDIRSSIYKSGVESGDILGMSYEDWLKTISGKDGKDGVTPTIAINDEGYWIINGTNTTIKAKGEDGSQITIGSDGYWYINGESTGVMAKAVNGIDGAKWYYGNSEPKITSIYDTFQKD